MTTNIDIRIGAPPPQDYIALRESVGWGRVSPAHARAALKMSICALSAWQEGECVGFVRAIGDGVLNVYIQDLIVSESYRGHGLARKLMSAILVELARTVPDTATMGLMSVSGLEEFYASFGFVDRRQVGRFGAGMTQELSKLTW